MGWEGGMSNGKFTIGDLYLRWITCRVLGSETETPVTARGRQSFYWWRRPSVPPDKLQDFFNRSRENSRSTEREPEKPSITVPILPLSELVFSIIADAADMRGSPSHLFRHRRHSRRKTSLRRGNFFLRTWCGKNSWTVQQNKKTSVRVWNLLNSSMTKMPPFWVKHFLM
jgi:hypothetical protein